MSSIRVAYQGVEGAFSHTAALEAFANSPQVETIGLHTFQQVFDAVENGDTQYGVIPAENSISGTFHVIYDHLLRSNLKIVGECSCVQEHCLIGLPGSNGSMKSITHILSQPMILEQCEAYVSSLELKYGISIERLSTWDTSGACQALKAKKITTACAIASEKACLFHELKIMERGIGNELNNETRYVIIAKQNVQPLSRLAPMKASVFIAVPNQPQSLFKIVAAFALRNLSILKIESRPAAAARSRFQSEMFHWDYIFYVDYEPSSEEMVNERLRQNLEEFTLWFREMGTYSYNDNKAQIAPPRWTQIRDLSSF